MFHSKEELADAMVRETDGAIDQKTAERIAAEALPGVWLETFPMADEGDIPIGACKLGGCPDLPVGMDWPMRPAYPDCEERAIDHRKQEESFRKLRQERPDLYKFDGPYQTDEILHYESNSTYLHFVAQFDLKYCAAFQEETLTFPSSGHLLVFYDALTQPWGWKPPDSVGSTIIYVPDGVQLERKAKPDAFARYPTPGHPPVGKAQPHPMLAPLPFASAAFEAIGLPDYIQEAYSEWWDDDERMWPTSEGRDWRCHRLGGWPTPIQNDMQAECAIVRAGFSAGDSADWNAARAADADRDATEWVFLAQIGSDDNAGMLWGDAGQLYLWIRRDDLAARRFENARLVLQCS